LPGNRRAFALSAPYIEVIHDWLVPAWWPDVEPVGPEEYRDHGLLESAVARPFQTVFGKSLFQSVPEKAAALFHSLIANHPFENGNKRTAVIALDLFLTANGFFLYLENEGMYQLAKDTASYIPQGITHEQILARITGAVKDNTMPHAKMKESGLDHVALAARRIRKAVRKHPHNLTSPLNANTHG
jgi:death-on-curing family protein